MFGSNQPKRDKTLLELLEQELKWLHGQISHTYHGNDAMRQIKVIQDHLIALHKKEQETLIPERIKSMENTIAELLMMGKEENK